MKKIVYLMISFSIFPILLYGMNEESTQEENHFGKCSKVTEFLDKTFYQEAIEKLPIICVDILVVDPSAEKYLVLLRKMKPKKNVYWVPGGRMNKGETFFESAKRKCWEKGRIEVKTKKVLGIYNLMFPDSEWNSSAHNPVVAILATYDSQKGSVSHDELHKNHKWLSLSQSNENPYIEAIRKEALTKMLSKKEMLSNSNKK